jgi:hypothetical protein
MPKKGINVGAAEGGFMFNMDQNNLRVPLLYLDPLFDQILMLFPQDNLRELNRRLRHYCKYEPYIHNIIDFHTETPVSDFELRAPQSPEAQDYYNDFKDRLDLLTHITDALRDYWSLGECGPAGSSILMSDGTEKNVELIRSGDEVISHTGFNRRVIVPTRRFADENLFGLQIRGDGKVPKWFTGNHPILVARESDHPCRMGYWYDSCIKSVPCHITARGNKRLDGTRKVWKYGCKQQTGICLDYVKVSDIRPGDYAVFPQYQENCEEGNMIFARYLGYYASEGCIIKSVTNNNGLGGVCVVNTDPKIVKEMVELSTKLSGKPPTIRRVDNCQVIYIYSTAFAENIQRMCSGLAKTKTLSEKVMCWKPEYQLEFLKSFALGDGWVDNAHVVLSSSSCQLASQLYGMCVRLGMHPSRYTHSQIARAPHSLKPMQCTMYTVKLSKEDSARFQEFGNKLENVYVPKKTCHYSFTKDGYLFKKIVDVKIKPFKGPVYSMEVEKDHSYVSEGIAVHNSFTFGNWDPTTQEFSSFVQYPPEEIQVTSAFITPNRVYSLRPNKEISKILTSTSPDDQRLAEFIKTEMPDHADSIKRNQPFPLDDSRLIVLQRRMSGYIPRGVSPLLSVVKDLIYEDFLNLFRTTFLQRHCFSEDTDILTLSGFKNVKDLKKGEMIASFNPKTEQIEYHQATEMNFYSYNGDMVNFKNDNVDLLVTKEHRVFYRETNGKEYVLDATNRLPNNFVFRCADKNNVLSETNLSVQDNVKYVPYNGMVYCPTVPPHHLIFAKRNGHTVITGQSYPLRLFKLGSEAKGFIPSKKMFREFQSQLIASTNDPNYNLITHPFVNVEYYTGQDKILNLIPHYELTKMRIFAGLFMSDAMVTGEKTPYSSTITYMRALMHRYLSIRNSVEIQFKTKVFQHLARARKFYKPTEAEVAHHIQTRKDEKLIIPEFFWQKANLLSNQSIMQMALQMRGKFEVPMRYIAEFMGWNIDDMKSELKKEEGTRVDPRWRKAVDDAIAKNPEFAKKIMLGDDIDTALKALSKEKMQEEPKKEEAKIVKPKKKEKAEYTAPPAPEGPVTPLEERKTPEEGANMEEKTPPAIPEVGEPGERRPRPSEAEKTTPETEG